ncbi:MAG: septum formation initiator family protein [Bacteroidaceae bacterium]|nr:septum formation initiator family protein [Bacteroidaceae bacterium]
MSTKIINFWQAVRHHKYLWTIIIFIIVAGFLDENSIWNYYHLRKHNKTLKDEIRLYEKEYKDVNAELQRLKKSPRAYEEVARVRLLMKSDDEDVYVIEAQESPTE